MFVYKLSLICSLLLSDAFAQEAGDEDGTTGTVSDVSEVAANSEFTPSAQDIANFRQTFQRYSERMKDFRDETMIMVDIKKEEAENEIARSYEKPLLALSEDNMELRKTAVSKFEQFLKKYPNKEQGAEIRFQLAEIYFEEASEKYVQDQEKQDVFLEENPTLELEPVLVDMGRSVQLYEEIVNRFRQSKVTDGALYMLGFCLGQGNFEQKDEERSVAYFEQLLSEHPESNFAAETHYVVGEHYFNINELERARDNFFKAVSLSKPDEGEYGGQYEYALYRLAWTYYRLEEYSTSLNLFTQLQDYSVRKERDTGQPVDAMEESLEYTAFSFIDISIDEGLEALDVGKKFYEDNGDRDYSSGVFVEMAGILEKQSLNYEAVDIYRYLQAKWPYAPENPRYQKQVAILLGAEGEDVAYHEALKVLTDLYAENGEWWRQNRNNPEAQDLARAYSEDFLLDVAKNQLSVAYMSQDQADYQLAAEHYENYLSKFPFADDFYEAQWFLALSFEGAEKPNEAIKQFEQLIKSKDDHDYAELSLVRKLFGLYSMVQNTQKGDFTQLPAAAEVQQKELLIDDSERLIYGLMPEVVSLINTFKESKALDFDARYAIMQRKILEIEDPKRAETLELLAEDLLVAKDYLFAQEKSIEFNIGRIYFAYGQFDLAREQYNKVIDEWPESIEAEYSASSIIGTHQDQLNWVMVKQEAERFITMVLGPDGIIKEEVFAGYIQEASLQVVQKALFDARDLMIEGKVQEGTVQLNFAAEGYEEYLEEYSDMPRDEYANILLLAANTYGDAGNIEKANELSRNYVNKFPQKKESRALLFTIAINHQNALELEEAIKYYDILYSQTYGKGISYPDAVSAKYNSALLKVGLGDYEGAAKDLEFYVRKFPDLPNSELTYFSIGKYWEKVSDYKALEFYTKYLKKYGDQNSDRTMEAHYRRIQIYEKQEKSVYLKREWDTLLKSYERLLAKNGDASALMRKYAAERELSGIPEKLKKYKSYKYTRNDQKNAALMLEAKADFLILKEECSAYGEKYKDLSAVMAGGYCIGSAQLFLAGFLRALPLDNIPWEQQIIFEEKIDEEVIPIENGGLESLAVVLDIAEKKEVWNEWADLALEELSSRDPETYPPQKEARRYKVESQYVPNLGPISIEIEKKRIVDISEEETPTLEEAPKEELPSNDENEIRDDSDLEIERPDWGEPNEDGAKEEGGNDETDGE